MQPVLPPALPARRRGPGRHVQRQAPSGAGRPSPCSLALPGRAKKALAMEAPWLPMMTSADRTAAAEGGRAICKRIGSRQEGCQGGIWEPSPTCLKPAQPSPHAALLAKLAAPRPSAHLPWRPAGRRRGGSWCRRRGRSRWNLGRSMTSCCSCSAVRPCSGSAECSGWQRAKVCVCAWGNAIHSRRRLLARGTPRPHACMLPAPGANPSCSAACLADRRLVASSEEENLQAGAAAAVAAAAAVGSARGVGDRRRRQRRVQPHQRLRSLRHGRWQEVQ